MAVFRVEKTRDFTIMSNHHLKNKSLTLKAKGLLSLMLSLPEEWDYTLKGLSFICKEGIDAIRVAVLELEREGYVERARKRNNKGQLADIEYIIHEFPINKSEQQLKLKKPTLENPILDNSTLENPILENPTQLSIKVLNKEKLKTDYIENLSINQEVKLVNTEKDERKERWVDRYNKNIELIKNNIEYESIVYESDSKVINEIIAIMAEVLTLDTQYYNIENKKYPAELVKQRFREVDYNKLSAFLLDFHRHTDKIYNPKAYLITALFNMPATADTMLTNMVKNDTAKNRKE